MNLPSSKSYKIVILGPFRVGKSCFIREFIGGTYREVYDPTVDNSYRKLLTVDNEECILTFYDSYSSDEFIHDQDRYLGIEGFIAIYSITSNASFQKIRNLYDHIIYFTGDENIPCILVGNKSDLNEERQVAISEGQELARGFNWKFLEASARNKINVVETFEEIVRSIRVNRGWRHYGHDSPSTQAAKPRKCIIL